MNKNYQFLKEKVNYVIQDSNLDIGAVYFVMKDIMNNLEHLYYAQINKEMLEEKGKNSNEESLSDKNRKE